MQNGYICRDRDDQENSGIRNGGQALAEIDHDLMLSRKNAIRVITRIFRWRMMIHRADPNGENPPFMFT